MLNSVFIKRLLSDASRNMLRVKKYDNTVICYTLLPKYNVTQTDNEEYITLYNLITDKNEDIKIEDISTFIIQDDNIYKNTINELGYVGRCKNALKLFEKTKLPIETFYKNYMNSVAIENEVQDAVCSFDFLLDEDIISGKKIPNKSLKKLKSSFLKLVDEKLNENKEELQQLKDECDSEEDQEDIDQILEMFDSCKDEICFENIENITDILNQWPPLLLPLPDSLDKLLNVTAPIVDENNKLKDLADLITNLDSETLNEFKKILDDAKEILEESVYNDYKNVLDAEYTKKLNEKL